MLDVEQFQMVVVRPVLLFLHDEIPHSVGAEQLLVATGIQESRLRALRQYGGPARGLFQMEPATFNDLLDNFVKHRHGLDAKVRQLLAPWPTPLVQLQTNLSFAAAMARILYFRAPEPMPAAGDLESMAKFYKLRYNTPLGAATVKQFKDNATKNGWPFVQSI